jgi:hypothetical protein
MGNNAEGWKEIGEKKREAKSKATGVGEIS